jgi:SAM-dependent methyltransferase
MSARPSSTPWGFFCHSCRVPLELVDPNESVCPRCRASSRCTDGIWRMLREGREEALRGFVEQYEAVRSAEGRRVQDPAHLRALPFRDLSGRRPQEWAIRSRSYRALVRRVVTPLERRSGRPLRVLDLGSGLGWLAYRLASRGHDVAAVDLLTGASDGLGAHHHYDVPFVSVQAEFDHLPFADASADLAVCNASLHYAADYATTLREGLRVLAPGGRLVIMDTPIYRDAASGLAMVRRRDEAFERELGVRSRAPRSEGFLTYERLDRLAGELHVRWRLIEPWYGVRWWMEPLLARVRRSGEPARFKLAVADR